MPPPSVPLPEPGIKCCPHRRLRFIPPTSLHCVSSLAAWTPLAGSLDPSLLQQPSRWRCFALRQNKFHLFRQTSNQTSNKIQKPYPQ